MAVNRCDDRLPCHHIDQLWNHLAHGTPDQHARAIARDAMVIPVVTGDIDPGAVEDLITLCVQYDRSRVTPGREGHPQPRPAAPPRSGRNL